MVDKDTGKFNTIGKVFRCYAASSERFPGVRSSRWKNYNDILNGIDIQIPKQAKNIRIHGSGDFFSQEYFDKWLTVCKNNPDVNFWAFTKSVQFWVNRINDIPRNLTLQASKGGLQDHLIEQYNLKYAQVFNSIQEVPVWMKIDTNDDLARFGTESFALLENFSNHKKTKNN